MTKLGNGKAPCLIREELKERGYSFRRPTWMKWFHTEAERQEELAWARDCGYQIEGH